MSCTLLKKNALHILAYDPYIHPFWLKEFRALKLNNMENFKALKAYILVDMGGAGRRYIEVRCLTIYTKHLHQHL
jgi:hypothetical protein